MRDAYWGGYACAVRGRFNGGARGKGPTPCMAMMSHVGQCHAVLPGSMGPVTTHVHGETPRLKISTNCVQTPARRAMASAVPPRRLKNVSCTYGVIKLPGGMYSAFLESRKDNNLWQEHLGAAHTQPWFAAVCHDLLLCKKVYDSGDRELSALDDEQNGPGRGGSRPPGASGVALVPPSAGSDQRLNYPLSAYTNQAAFWDALEGTSFGQLAIQMRISRDLEKVGGQAWCIEKQGWLEQC